MEATELEQTLLAFMARNGDIERYIGYEEFMSHGYSFNSLSYKIKDAEETRLEYEMKRKNLLNN